MGFFQKKQFTAKNKRQGICNLNEIDNIETIWVVIYVEDDNASYFNILLQTIFQKRLKNSQVTKLLKQTFSDYKI